MTKAEKITFREIPESGQKKWSELTGSNRRQSPWQGDALPTELNSHPCYLN